MIKRYAQEEINAKNNITSELARYKVKLYNTDQLIMCFTNSSANIINMVSSSSQKCSFVADSLNSSVNNNKFYCEENEYLDSSFDPDEIYGLFKGSIKSKFCLFMRKK